ncbi:unnamed protein product [Anisakis simplex]|uniref:Solute carrier family 40 protein n=1 Tax=Anisakis simplex TaxID=6269 RepID=A0A0M3JVQ6_ANISI|nr:unnamed protein product [Anisakis simplex]
MKIYFRKLWKLRAVWFFLMLVIIQAIFGYLAKSVACLTATVLMISDYLGEHSIDRNRPNAFRRIDSVFQPRRFVQMSTFIGVRAQQIIHAIGNHGTCLVLFVAAIILYIQHDAILADSIATFVITVAVLSNAASVIPKHLYELRYIGTLEDTYEEVLSTGQEI